MNIESNLQQETEQSRELTDPLGEGVPVPEHLRHWAQMAPDQVAINFNAAKAVELVSSVS